MSRARLIPSILRTTTVVTAAACLFGLQSPGAHARPTVPFAPVCALDGPTDGAAFNQSGSDIFYVADTQNHQVILLSDAFGCSAFVIGSEGSGDGQFSEPQGIAVDADGFIYVSDTGNDRVQKFDNLDGLDPGDEVSFLQVFVGGVALDEPMGMGANDLGHIFVADTGNDRIVVYATDGSLIDTFGEEDDGDSQTNGEFIEPVDVAACDSTTPGFGARIFVLDRGRDNVQVFDEDRDFLFSFSSQGSGLGQLSSPGGIATDHRCAVYIADTGNDRIQMFDADGGFLEVLGGGNDPTGIAVSGGGAAGPTAGGVYIVNTGGDGIDAFEFIDYDTDDDGLIDSDGDGLPDIWEEDGIDIGFDGTTDLDLPGLGADPDHKNLFIEVDYMTSHEPRQDALDLVIDRFATAPVDNPDGDPGITLNITVDDEIPHQSNINTWGGFDTIKGMWFGTAAERAAANADVILTARQLAYRYALYAHTRDSGGSSGRAKGGGNFLVTLGASNWGADPATGHNVGSLMEQAGTFMHELGHTLSLGHGGVDGTNYKPNYLSVMNYWFQTSWIPNPSASMNARLDYSGQGLADLDETDLDETEGIGLASVEDADDFTAWTDAAMISRGSQASIALDWDWSNTGTGTDTTLPDIDINQDRVCVSPGNDNVLDSAPANDDIVVGSQIQDGPDRICDSPTANDDVQGSTAQGRTLGDSQPELAGFDDWEFLNTTPKALSFRDSPGFAEGGEPFEDEQPELTDEEALRIAAFWQSVFEEKYTYSVKFVCVPEVGLEGHAVSPGRYRTVINVHNPHSSEVSFKTKAVIARPENEKRGEITELVETRLQDDEAMSINCKTIAERFSEDATIGDGFVVIKSNQLLDVVAVYTSRDSIEVEYVQPFTPPEEEGEEEKDEENGRDDDDKDDDGDKPRRKRADLVPQEVESAQIPRVNINGPFCAFKAGTDNGILVVKVANIGPGKASSSTTRVIFYDEPYRRRRSSFVVATVDVNTPEVDANSALLLEVPVPDSWPVGQNDPLRIIVDSEDDVDNELKENNNEADGRCFLPG